MPSSVNEATVPSFWSAFARLATVLLHGPALVNVRAEVVQTH